MYLIADVKIAIFGEKWGWRDGEAVDHKMDISFFKIT